MPVFEIHCTVTSLDSCKESSEVYYMAAEDIQKATIHVMRMLESIRMELVEDTVGMTKKAELGDKILLCVYRVTDGSWCIWHRSGTYAAFGSPESVQNGIELLDDDTNVFHWTDEELNPKPPEGDIGPGLSLKQIEFIKEVLMSDEGQSAFGHSKHYKVSPSCN